MADILEEVLSDAKDEKKILAFRRILPIIVIFTVLIACSITVFNWHSNSEIEHNQKVGDILVGILESDDGANILDDFIKDGDNRQIELAQIFKADTLIKSAKKEEAYKKLEEIIAEEKYHEITKSYASIMWLNLVLTEDNISDEKKMQARNHMQYFDNKDQVFFISANILKSLFYQKSKQYDLALLHANLVLNSSDVPLIAKEQAKAIIANIKYYDKT